jgi:transcriptional regulator with XRE-family HTH domain
MRARQAAVKSKMWQSAVRANQKSHRVARARALRNLTQSETASLAALSVATLTSVENRRHAPSRRTRERLARVLALPESELF